MSEPSRSPLKDKPLRLPGQSLQEEWRRQFDGWIENWALFAVFAVCIAVFEWIRYVLRLQLTPWPLTFLAAVAVALAAWRFVRIRPRLRALRLGIEGERAVGQFLERLRENGYQVFHDLVGEGFNVDHVVIGPGGVFTVETKTRSKPARGDARVTWDGERVLVAGLEPERDVVAQAQAQARWLRELLMDSAGRAFDVQPIVVFPGWYVEAAPGSQRSVWVMEPKGLPAFLSRQAPRLALEDVKLASFHLSRYVRSRERSRVGEP